MNRKLWSCACAAIVIFTLCPFTTASEGSALSGKQKLLAELTASDGAPGDSLGWKVAMSGNTAVVGAPFAHNGAGAAYVFVEGPGGWGNMTQTAELTPSDAAPSVEFGLSVGISGNTIVVGSFAHNAAYVFVEPTSGWQNMTETAILSAYNRGVQDLFGADVAIAGATIAVSAYQANFDQGRVDVFVRPKGGWVSGHRIGYLVASDGTVNSLLGAGLAMNGETIVAGASGFTGMEGAAYVYVKPAGGWKGKHTETAKLTPSDGAPSNFFGISVAISRVGEVVAVGAEGADNNLGAAYVFAKPPGGWSNMTETAKLTASNGQPNDFLGASVATLNGRVAAGAPTNGGRGAVYTFFEPAGGWASETETAELKAAGSGELGSSVAIVGGTILGGARYALVGGWALGAAYVFGP